MLSVQQTIETKIQEALSPSYLEVLNESYMHNVPQNSETHFKVVVVSDAFNTKNRVQRHQTINLLLADELAGPVHALSMQTQTKAEWSASGGRKLSSPACHGGSENDRPL